LLHEFFNLQLLEFSTQTKSMEFHIPYVGACETLFFLTEQTRFMSIDYMNLSEDEFHRSSLTILTIHWGEWDLSQLRKINNDSNLTYVINNPINQAHMGKNRSLVDLVMHY